MKGLSFYFFLRNTLKKNQVIGLSKNNRKYAFIDWNKNGELLYKSSGNTKTIPVEIIVSSYFVKSKKIIINDQWLKLNGNNNWCTPPILNNLIDIFNTTNKK